MSASPSYPAMTYSGTGSIRLAHASLNVMREATRPSNSSSVMSLAPSPYRLGVADSPTILAPGFASRRRRTPVPQWRAPQ